METNLKIKYTTEGKKVVVIGDLNQTEKIVQEIENRIRNIQTDF